MLIKGYIRKSDSWIDRELYLSESKDGGLRSAKILFGELSQFEDKFVSCRYALSDKPFDSLNDEKLFAFIHGFYSDREQEFAISDITSSDYKCGCVGGHNLYNEFSSFVGRYLILEIEEVEKPRWMVEEDDY